MTLGRPIRCSRGVLAFVITVLAAVVRSFRGGFPHVTLWETATGDTLLLGSLEPLEPDEAGIEERMATPAIAGQLAAMDLQHAADLLFLQRYRLFGQPFISIIGHCHR